MSARSKPVMAADPFYQRLKALIIERTGMAFYAERDDDLTRILGERFKALGIEGCASYLELVADKEEMDELITELTIGETYFFRYKEQFEALRDIVLPEVIERNRERRSIRIWSAGCATGPEPYTVAIILKQRFGHLIDGWDVTVLGTDINRKFLERAREGVYDEWALRATPDSMRTACFERVAKRWRVRPEYRDWVKFRYHNLVDDAFPSLAHGIHDFDVIMCRNVVIYFTTETFRRIIGRFRKSLAGEGWLVVGHSELNNDLFKAFRPVEAPGAVLYRKTDAPPPARPAPLVADPFADYQPPAPSVPNLAALLAETAPEPPPLAPVVVPAAAEPAAEKPPQAVDELMRLADQGVWVEVGRLAKKLLDADPLDALLHLYAGLAAEHGRDLAAAAEAMRRAIYLDRGLALAHYHLGRLLREDGDRAGAARSFRNALRLIQPAAPDSVVPGTADLAAAELVGMLHLQIEAVG